MHESNEEILCGADQCNVLSTLKYDGWTNGSSL